MASGCVGAPKRLDVSALVRAHGEAGARGELEVRILDDPRDIQARLALAKLADEANRPAQALEQLEAVLRLGGPLGTRWHDDDRARFARLLAARGIERLRRESATALADLERARRFGATVDDITLARARSYVAIGQLRHVDTRTREAGRRVIAELRAMPFADPSWVGALDSATPRDRGLFGVWLWGQGAKRAAFEALSAWRARSAERDAATSALHAAYLRALAWWTPLEGALPPTAEMVGPARCRFVACSAADVLDEKDSVRRAEGMAAIRVGPLAPTTNGRDAAAWAWLTLSEAMIDGGGGWGRRPASDTKLDGGDRRAPSDTKLDGGDRRAPSDTKLDGGDRRASSETERDGDERRALSDAVFDGGWGRRLAQRVTLEALDRQAVPAFARPVLARLASAQAAGVPDGALGELAPWQRMVVAAERALDGASRAQIEAALGDAAAQPEGQRILAIVAPGVPAFAGDARDAAIENYLEAREHALPGARALALPEARRIAIAYRRDPAVAERLARDVVARAPDAAAAYAALGALWSVLDDPQRARIAWQAAVDASPEPAFVRGLADACARASDPDAALIHGTAAAAALGDPAPVWTALSRVLEANGHHHHALEAARSAIDLAGREALAAALDAGAAASRSLGRTGQADVLAARRARLAPPIEVVPEVGPVDAEAALRAVGDPTDALAALAAYRRRSTVTAIARMWIASRWNPHDVAIRAALLEAIALDDPRRALLVGELVQLAASPDDERGRAAIRALR